MTTVGVTVRRRLTVRGIVQGVGFRPHVARLAAELELAGLCRNDATCVVIEVEGPAATVAQFTDRLVGQAPALSRILAVETEELPTDGVTGFTITASTRADGARTLLPPDTALCPDCLRELADPADRRYRHPFITCTNCGPRLTITLDLPYDRPVTTMAQFTMCPTCRSEYADPADRRYHAQPIACHDCGPVLRVVDAAGRSLVAEPADRRAAGEAALAHAVRVLRGGGILAVKGIGGYHLACDAGDEQAVATLRQRKRRPDRPFALMAADLATAEQVVTVPADAVPLLTGPERPILLLPRTAHPPVAAQVAPGLDELGVMLPYAPVHHLLFAGLPDGSAGAPPVLVMTSGNRAGEPLCYTDADALARLGGIADAFLVHDRPIVVPCEDSVLAWGRGEAVPIRRSRGYAPLPLPLPLSAPTGHRGAPAPAPVEPPRVVLAAGAELKNTVALARDGLAFLSAHIGDLGSLESRAAYQRSTEQLLRFHRAAPALVVADRHPGYTSRAWASQRAADLQVPLLEVQHHHAHLASLAAEHGRLGQDLLGVVFDGTGYGCDATIWGGEFLLLRHGGRTADRLAHLGTVRLPGADAGVRNPVRTAALALLASGAGLDVLGEALTPAERTTLPRLLETGVGWVATSSVGRLFDVAAAILGVRARVSYEAQAAIELEAQARRWYAAQPGEPGRSPGAQPSTRLSGPALELPVARRDGDLVLDPDPFVRTLAARRAAGGDVAELAWQVHAAIAQGAAAVAIDQAGRLGLDTVGLTGGVFVNRVLLGLLTDRLRDAGLTVLTHRLVPAGDGGISLGQLAVGLAETAARGRS